MKYKLITLALIGMFSFNMISCTASESNKKADDLIKQEESISDEKIDNLEQKLENDNVFLALKGNGGSSGFNLLAKFNESESFDEIDIGADPFSITYSDSLNRIFFVDENGTIRTKGESDSNDYGLNSTGSYRMGAGYKMWDLGVAYKMPKDKSSLVYTNKDRQLIFVNSHGNQTVIGDNVGLKDEYSDKYINERFFKISADGKYVVFNDEYSLSSYNIETGERLEIDRFVEKFEISENGKNIVYTLKDNDGLLVKNLEKNTTRKYDEFPMYSVWDLKIFDDGSVVSISDIEEDMMWGFVKYIDGQGNVYKIPSKVICYEIFKSTEYVKIIDEMAYYIDGEFRLCRYKLGLDAVDIIENNVNDFEIVENNLYYTLNNGEVYKAKDMKNKELIVQKTDALDIYSHIEKLDDKNVLIKTGNNDIYINEKLVANDVESFVFYVDRLAYCKSNGEVYIVDMKTKKSKLEFKNYKEYDCLYYGNSILYTSELLFGM